MHRDPNGTGRRNTEPNINTFFTDKNLGKNERLAYIDNEIMRVEDSIVKLVMQRAFLKRRRNSFSPAVNLPPELLALIFEHACLPNGGEYDDRHYAHGEGLSGGTNLGLSVGIGAVTPLFIGTICSVWRHISQNTTQLWETVTLCVNNRRAESQAALLRSWLKHSGQRPLTIKLLEDDVDENENDNDTDWGIDVTSTSVIDVLAAHSQQWHTIDMFLPSTWKPILSRIKHRLPLLANATLRAAEGCPTLSRVDTFGVAPRLREVRLVGYSVTDVLLPWAQLQRLDGEYFSPGECLDTLHLGPKLRTCQFEQLYRGVHPFVVRPIRHECLESFELIMDTTHELQALFGALTLPNLTELVLSLSDEESVLRPVIPLMQRSFFKLQRLHLVGVTPEEDELIGFLKEQPTLNALLLINPGTETGGKLTQRFIDAMMPTKMIESSSGGDQVMERGKDSYLTPMLEHLEYQGATSFSSQTLTQLLVSRWRVGDEDDVGDEGMPHRSPTFGRPNPFGDMDDGPRTHPHDPPKMRTQLRSVIITTTKRIKFNCTDVKTVQSLIGEGMHLDFLADVNASFNS